MSTLDRRLGVRAIISDHVETWSLAVGEQRRRDQRRTLRWFLLTPTLIAAPFVYWHVDLRGIAQILAGLAVFTGLLFGLLGLIFNTGITLRKDGAAIGNAHSIRQVVADLRANVTYAIFVAIILDVVIVVCAAVSDPAKGVHWGWTPALLWLFVHLGLTLLMVLRRFRTAFNYLTR